MQTFLSEISYEDSAKVLDNKRLFKQTVENYQISRVIVGKICRQNEYKLWNSDIEDISYSARKLSNCAIFTKVEGRKIRTQKGFQNHPAVLMWQEHLVEHLIYSACCYSEALTRQTRTGTFQGSSFVSQLILFALYETILEENQRAVTQMLSQCELSPLCLVHAFLETAKKRSPGRFANPWSFEPRVLQSHRGNLYLKDPEHYVQYEEWAQIPYFYPSKTRLTGYYWPK